MSDQMKLLMGTVALEPTRWGKRQASFPVSDWLPRFASAGADGVELWEFHYLTADKVEQDRLAAAAEVIAIYNSYVGFADEDAEARARAVKAIERLQPAAVKYNLGRDATQLDAYRRNLLAWSDEIPASCRLLCECHPGTVLEKLDDAVAFFADLDPVRFGVIAHLSGDPAALDTWFSAFGERVQHVHVQLRGPESDPAVPANRAHLDPCFDVLKQHGFKGSLALEFTRGIGRDEQIEIIYANACVDLAYCREQLRRL